MNKYASASECKSFEERIIKFQKIEKMLKKQNITLVSINGYEVKLEDRTCGYNFNQGISVWENFEIIDIVNQLIRSRDNYKKRKSDDDNYFLNIVSNNPTSNF